MAQVLLIEDNKILAQYYVEVMAEYYQVTLIHDGEKAIRHAMDEVPDIIITDVMLRTFSGYELVKQLRSSDITQHIPVVMLTAKADFKSKLKGFQSGANDYIVKPVQENELLIRVQNQLALTQAVERKFNTGHSLSQDNGIVIKDKLVEAYRQYIRQNYGNVALTTELISEKLFVTKKQLERKISQCLGTSPNQYLNSYRLTQSRKLLLKGLPIKTVYEQCGYSSHAYFSKRFKEKYDCSSLELEAEVKI